MKEAIICATFLTVSVLLVPEYLRRLYVLTANISLGRHLSEYDNVL